MQVSGRVIIVAAFGLAIAMSGGAWFYHYSQVRQAAAFWGSPGGRLLVRGPEVTFYALGEIPDAAATVETIAGRTIEAQTDLSAKQGLVHLRHALYQDASFDWSDRQPEPLEASGEWRYAVRFAEEDQSLVILFNSEFTRVGKVEGDEIDALPAPRIADSVRRYLTDIGALKRDAAAR